MLIEKIINQLLCQNTAFCVSDGSLVLTLNPILSNTTTGFMRGLRLFFFSSLSLKCSLLCGSEQPFSFSLTVTAHTGAANLFSKWWNAKNLCPCVYPQRRSSLFKEAGGELQRHLSPREGDFMSMHVYVGIRAQECWKVKHNHCTGMTFTADLEKGTKGWANTWELFREKVRWRRMEGESENKKEKTREVANEWGKARAEFNKEEHVSVCVLGMVEKV